MSSPVGKFVKLIWRDRAQHIGRVIHEDVCLVLQVIDRSSGWHILNLLDDEGNVEIVQTRDPFHHMWLNYDRDEIEAVFNRGGFPYLRFLFEKVTRV